MDINEYKGTTTIRLVCDKGVVLATERRSSQDSTRCEVKKICDTLTLTLLH